MIPSIKSPCLFLFKIFHSRIKAIFQILHSASIKKGEEVRTKGTLLYKTHKKNCWIVTKTFAGQSIRNMFNTQIISTLIPLEILKQDLIACCPFCLSSSSLCFYFLFLPSMYLHVVFRL